MSQPPLEETRKLVAEDPQLLAYLPMLYVAWADGDLSADEIGSICSTVTKALDTGASCRELLGRWLDPAQPPSAQELQSLLVTIRRAARPLDADQKRSLSELGLALATGGGHQPSAAEREALVEIEQALGLAGPGVTRGLLVPERPLPAPIEPQPGFDVSAMVRLLEGGHHELRWRIKEILGRPEFRYQYDLDRPAYREQVLAGCRLLAAEGLGSLSFPPAYGGAGDVGAFVAVFETLALHDLSMLIKFGVQFGLFGGSILQLGNSKHHQRYLPQIGSLELPGCFAMTETGHGSNVADLETVARYDPAAEQFIIHTPHDGARKDYIGNAALHGRLATVFAQLVIDDSSHGVHALLVPIREDDGSICSGVRIEDCGEKLGLNGVDNGRIWFDQVRIPRENLLDRFAQVAADGTYTSSIASPSRRFFTMLGTLVGGRVSIALAGLSASKSALTIAVRYGARRRQFGPSGEAETVLLDYLTHQRRLLPRLATTYALNFALHHLAEQYAESIDDDRREVEAMAAGLKAYATWHATDTIQTCREACGGQGYLAANRFAALKADSDVFTTFEGDNTVLMQLVAKGLLTGYRRQFGEMKLLGLVRFLAGQAATAVAELNPIVTRMTDEDHLLDREFQLGAMRWREEHLLGTLARRLKKRIDAGQDAFQALIEVQDHAVELARAHNERVVLERFAEVVGSTAGPDLAAVLGTLCDLYALHRIEADRGWFLEHGYLEAGKAKAIRKLVTRLCGEVRLQALPLVDAFDIPDELLAAPIAI
jgi:acyl-CoA oxidase